MNKGLGLFIVFSLMVITNYAQSKVDSAFHLYLLAGQSNMAGRGTITDEYKLVSNAHVYMLDKNNEWVVAKHPLHFDKPQVVGVGPGLAFGIAMAEAHPDVRIGLVPCAVGGTSINAWRPGGYDSATKTHPYDDAAKRIEIAKQQGVFKGIIWHQGESDSDPQRAATYLPKLKELISNLRMLTGNSQLPFVAGELGMYRPVFSSINTILLHLPQQVSYTAVASAEGLVHKGDSTHFDAPSATELGRRMAIKMQQLQAKK